MNFTCEASGSLPINYSWLYNDNYIVNVPGYIEGVNSATLMIVNVNVTDWGVYSCEVTNIVNNDTSHGATLHGKCWSLYVQCMHACVYIHLLEFSRYINFMNLIISSNQ